MDKADRARTQLLIVEDDAAMRELLAESLVEEAVRRAKARHTDS